MKARNRIGGVSAPPPAGFRSAMRPDGHIVVSVVAGASFTDEAHEGRRMEVAVEQYVNDPERTPAAYYLELRDAAGAVLMDGGELTDGGYCLGFRSAEALRTFAALLVSTLAEADRRGMLSAEAVR